MKTELQKNKRNHWPIVISREDRVCVLNNFKEQDSKSDMETRNIGVNGTGAFATTGDIGEELLAITPMHPMRLNAVQKLLTRSSIFWALH